jgi:hypothetical protein
MSHDSTEFAALEAAADEEYYSNPIPHPASTISKWHLLTVLEDLLRMPFIGKVNTSTQNVESINDRSKYGLRHALNLIAKKSDKKNDISKLPERVTHKYMKEPLLYSKRESTMSGYLDSHHQCIVLMPS